MTGWPPHPFDSDVSPDPGLAVLIGASRCEVQRPDVAEGTTPQRECRRTPAPVTAKFYNAVPEKDASHRAVARQPVPVV